MKKFNFEYGLPAFDVHISETEFINKIEKEIRFSKLDKKESQQINKCMKSFDVKKKISTHFEDFNHVEYLEKYFLKYYTIN